mgnify:CR=1 FL=1
MLKEEELIKGFVGRCVGDEYMIEFLFVLLTLKHIVVIYPDPPLVIAGTVTAYSELDSCHYENCLMASGKSAYIGAAACPRVMALGTKIIIEGQSYICEDRTSKLYDGRFDLFFGYGEESYRRAKQFGIQNKEIVLYNLDW